MDYKKDLRITECFSLGLKWNTQENSFLYEDINISMVDIITSSDQEWSNIIKGVLARLKEIKNV